MAFFLIKSFVGLMLALLLSGAAVAEEQSVQKLDDMVVTATKTPKKLELVPHCFRRHRLEKNSQIEC